MLMQLYISLKQKNSWETDEIYREMWWLKRENMLILKGKYDGNQQEM